MITTFKDDHIIPSSAPGFPYTKKVGQKPTECSGNTKNMTPQLSEAVLPGKKLLSTPSQKDSDSKAKATNSRVRKRDAFGQSKGEISSPINTITRFTIGKSDPAKSSNAKRKLVMNELKHVQSTEEKGSTPEKKLVTFQKAGSLSPVKIPAAFRVEANTTNAGKSSLTEVI